MIRRLVQYARNDFWDLLSWIAFAVGFTYIFLKVAGILHSPFISDLIGVGSVAFFFGKHAQKLDTMEKDVNKLKSDFNEMKESFREHEQSARAHA